MASSRKNFSIWTLAEFVWNQTEASEMGQKSIGWKSHGNHKIGGNGQKSPRSNRSDLYWNKAYKICNYRPNWTETTKMSYFASTAHPGTQSVAARARQLAKPPNRLFNTSLFTKVYYDGRKLIAPKPDSKTSENQQVEEIWERVPR